MARRHAMRSKSACYGNALRIMELNCSQTGKTAGHSMARLLDSLRKRLSWASARDFHSLLELPRPNIAGMPRKHTLSCGAADPLELGFIIAGDIALDVRAARRQKNFASRSKKGVES